VSLGCLVFAGLSRPNALDTAGVFAPAAAHSNKYLVHIPAAVGWHVCFVYVVALDDLVLVLLGEDAADGLRAHPAGNTSFAAVT
jgi:hypothetical protein